MLRKKIIIICLMCALQIIAHALDFTHIHTDACDYYTGDRIWIRVYVLDSATAKNQYEDRYVYVELYDPKYLLVKRVRIIQHNNAYCGYIDLPKQAETGVWSLRAYTQYIAQTSTSIPLQPVFVYGKHRSGSAPLLTLPLLPRDEPAYDTLIYASMGERLQIQVDSIADVSISMIDELKMQRHQSIGIAYNSAQNITKSTDTEAQHETCALLAGRVQTLWRKKPVQGAQVNLIIPRYQLYATTFTDENGQWMFSDVDLPEGTQCILAAQHENNHHALQLVVDEYIYPPLYASDTIALQSMLISADSSLYQPTIGEYTNLDSALLLDEINVTAKYYNETRQEKTIGQLADISYGEKQIEEFGVTCIHELLRRVPGVRVFQDKCYIRTANSIFGDTPAVIAINGVIQEDTYDLDVVQMQDIARVDIFKTGSTVIWGARGGSGVVSIILKDGAMDAVQTNTYSPAMKRITLAGYQPQENFYFSSDPTYKSRTAIWNPLFRESNISIVMPNNITRYRLIIDGIGINRQIFHKEIGIEVSR